VDSDCSRATHEIYKTPSEIGSGGVLVASGQRVSSWRATRVIWRRGLGGDALDRRFQLALEL
jgi:hypothetical protein